MKTGDNYHGLKLLAYCGGGAYGEVFYCEDLTHKKMAVKILSKQKIGAHWKRELKGITNYRKLTMEAPHLLQIYQVEEDEDHFFYTMEAADSLSPAQYKADTLAARLDQGALPDKDIFSVISGIFEGIETIHSAGFAHRDIKPDNILFINGIPKLADLGLLSSLNMTMSALAGTFEFIPPEIRSSDNFNSYDNASRQKCDLYAFGKVIYCIITGMDPLNFPSLPKNLSTSLPVKFFLRLSWKLCSQDPSKRLDNYMDVKKAIGMIEHKLLYGEHWLDKFSYVLLQSEKNDQSFVKELRHIKPGTWSLAASIITTIILLTVLPSEYHQVFWGMYHIFMALFFLFSWLCFYVVFDILLKLVRLFRRR